MLKRQRQYQDNREGILGLQPCRLQTDSNNMYLQTAVELVLNFDVNLLSVMVAVSS